jgi:hypothetical protein
MDRPRVNTGDVCPALLTTSVTSLARAADRIGPSSRRHMADVAVFPLSASSCGCRALRARHADPGVARSGEFSTSVTDMLTRFGSATRRSWTLSPTCARRPSYGPSPRSRANTSSAPAPGRSSPRARRAPSGRLNMWPEAPLPQRACDDRRGAAAPQRPAGPSGPANRRP